jgi:hypothetical protein
MEDFCSPQMFIDWGILSLVGIALQRRVYLGSDRKHLCPNPYTILCGPAGVGKGMVLGEIANILNHPKLQKKGGLSEQKQSLIDEMDPEDSAKLSKKISEASINNMLIPVAANATTFEALARAFGKANRLYRVKDPVTGILRPVQHSSICFLLEEMGSLFRKHTEDINTLLCETYDCKERYIYDTKHQGMDDIRRPCSSILAGTTPDFLRRVFSSALLNEGFASRSVFVVAMQNRFRRYETPSFCTEQVREHELLVDHIRALTSLEGVCKFTPEALEYNKHWYEKDYATILPNAHPKLLPYYARINITHAKLAMCKHYLDKLDNEITLDDCQWALKFLQKTEQPMHLALKIDNANPLAIVADDIYKYIRNKGGASSKQIKMEFYDSCPDPNTDVPQILNDLASFEKIQKDPSGRPDYWIVMRNVPIEEPEEPQQNEEAV